MICTSALMIWRSFMLVCGNESPMVVVLSGSMEPSMFRGDILVLYKRPTIDVGDVVVYQIANQATPIVHRIASIQDVYDKKSGKT